MRNGRATDFLVPGEPFSRFEKIRRFCAERFETIRVHAKLSPMTSANGSESANGPAPAPRTAWQPMTFGGVAAFAHARLSRLLVVWLVAALCVAASVIWFLNLAWLPVLETSFANLPNRSEIRGGKLDWRGPARARLGEGPFLCVLVDAEGSAAFGQIADVQLELRNDGLKVSSLLGYQTISFPRDRSVALNRLDAGAWWNAWKPVLLSGAGAAVVVGLFLSWALLATLYAGPVKFLAFFLDRDANWMASWRLSGAALMPGALVVCGAIFLYGLRQLNLAGLLVVFPLHLIVGWIYVACAPARLPRLRGVLSGAANPFGAPSGTPAENPLSEE
jgi:hypothetical protein